ncbi:MAG: amino acid adenylation domain-containing protein, partial [Pseudomonadota bacterium]
MDDLIQRESGDGAEHSYGGVSVDTHMPLSLVQRDVYFDQQRSPLNPKFNIGGYIAFRAIDVGRLQRAHGRLIETDPIFGLRLYSRSGEVVQRSSAKRSAALEVLDFSAEQGARESAREWMDAQFLERFPAQDADLYRCRLLKVAPNEYWYMFIAHHLIMDGWSFANLCKRLAHFYADPMGAVDLGPPWYASVADDMAYAQSTKHARDLAYWEQTLAPLPPRVLTPHYQPLVRTPECVPSGRHVLSYDPGEFSRIEEQVAAQGWQLAQFLMAVVVTYVGSLAQFEPFAVAQPVHNRRGRGQRQMLGLFTNTNILRFAPEADWTVAQLMEYVGQVQRKGYRHSRLPYGDLVRSVGTTGDGAPSLADVRFNYLKMDSELLIDGKPADIHYLTHHHEPMPLAVVVWDQGRHQPVEIQLDYNVAYFAEAEAQLLGARLRAMIARAAAQPDCALSALCELPPAERTQLDRWGRSEACIEATPVLTSIARQVAATPQAIAVESDDEQLTYAELGARSNQLARALVEEYGVRPGDFVGVCCQRTTDMVVALLGAMKAGAGYVPLDPTYPRERLEFMLEDSGARVVLTQLELFQWLELDTQSAVLVDRALHDEQFAAYSPAELSADEVSIDATTPAYVIYTSGSTGKPKGVLIEHGALAASTRAREETYEDAPEAFLLLSSYSFDSSVVGLFWTLTSGGRLVLFAHGQGFDFSKLAQALVRHEITHYLTLPDVHGQLLRHLPSPPPSLRVAIVAGSACARTLVAAHFEASWRAVRLYNEYGPTEACVWSACFECTPQCLPSYATVPIGTPPAHARLRILDGKQNPVPAGHAGELYISGPGLAREYLNRPELTAQRFVTLADRPAQRWFRTGDVVRWLASGELEYLGRADSQVKINGFRIELEEVESALAACPAVAGAAVVAVEREGRWRLGAFLIADGTDTEHDAASAEQALIESAKATLAQSLPAYMHPHGYQIVAELPRTPSGKLDRKGLPPFEFYSPAEHVAPATETERRISALWCRIFGVTQLSAEADFFELGGHSLLAASIASEASKEFAKDVPVVAVFDHRTIRSLASFIEGQQDQQFSAIPRASREVPLALSFAQQRLWFVDSLEQSSSQYNLPGAIRVVGALDLRALQQALDGLVERHEILRTVYCEDAQVVRPAASVALESVALCGHALSDPQVQAHIDAEASKPFRLDHDLMLRCRVLQLGVEEHIVLLTMHHIASDGWSLATLIRDLVALYTAALEETSAELAPLPIQYADYAQWQRATLGPEALADGLAVWRDRLDGMPEVHALPLDRPWPARQGYAASVVHRQLSTGTCARIRRLAEFHDASTFMLLQSVFALLLGRWSASDDVAVVTPTAGRAHADVEGLIGNFLNNLIIRSKLDPSQSFRDMLSQSRDVILEAFSHQHVPYEVLVDALCTDRDLRYLPLCQVKFVLQNYVTEQLSLPGAQVELIHDEYRHVRFDLDLTATETAHGMSLAWMYKRDLFDHATIERLASAFERLLDGVLGAPDAPVGSHALVEEFEGQALLERGCGPRVGRGRDSTV